MPPAANSSGVQLEGQWDDVVPRAVRVHGAAQGTPQERQLFNVANHRFADYPELRDVNKLYIRRLSTFAHNQQPCHQDPAVPYAYPNIGLAQGAPEHERVISPVRTNLPLMHRFPTGFSAGPPRKPSFGVCPSVYCTIPRPPFMIHRLTSRPLLSNQRSKISDDSPVVMCITQIPRLTWFGWNQAPLGDTKW